MGSVHYHRLNHGFSRLYGKANIAATGPVFLQQTKYTKSTHYTMETLAPEERNVNRIAIPMMPALQRSAMYIRSNKVNLITLCNYNQGAYIRAPSHNISTKGDLRG